MRKGKISFEQKISAVKQYLSGIDSMNHIALSLGVDFKAIKQWVVNFQSLGEEGLKPSTSNSKYSIALKEAAVREYQSGNGSLMDICKKYGIKSTYQLRNWILKYNSHEKLKASGTGGVPIMTNGRKTTFDE